MYKMRIQRTSTCLWFLAATVLIALPLRAAVQSANSPGPRSSLDPALMSQYRAWLDLNAPKALRPTPDPDLWTVMVTQDQETWEFFGSVRILSSFDLQPPTGALAAALAKTSYTLVDRRMVVASVGGDDRATLYLAAMAIDFGESYLDRDGNPIRSFVPVFANRDPDLTAKIARRMADAFNGQSQTEPRRDNGPHLMPRCGCEEGCDAAYDADLALAVAQAVVCEAQAGAAATACILACPPCTAACLALEAALVAQCLLDQVEREREAFRRWSECLHNCISTP